MQARINVIPCEYYDGLVITLYGRPAIATQLVNVANVAQLTVAVDALTAPLAGTVNGVVSIAVYDRKVRGYDKAKYALRRELKITA